MSGTGMMKLPHKMPRHAPLNQLCVSLARMALSLQCAGRCRATVHYGLLRKLQPIYPRVKTTLIEPVLVRLDYHVFRPRVRLHQPHRPV